MLWEEFPPNESWFEGFQVRVDLGFFGIEKDFVCKELAIPNKKPRKRELTLEQKAENKLRRGERSRLRLVSVPIKKRGQVLKHSRLN
jgi:hypothetical protein